jgi:ATP-dependent helicase YprA (DUF1998 family)
LNPIKLSKQLQETLVSYLTTTFDVNRDGKEERLAAFIRDSFNRPRALFAGPYLELTVPYQTAVSLQQLADSGVITPKLLQMPCFREGRPLPINAPLYSHQAKAMQKLCAEQRNVVVSSGTGSGKTECFLIPILNDLLLDPSPGVRAILIYPLNALVNDQLDRLRVLLRDTPITFGRYTSELEEKAEKARAQMHKEWREMESARRELFSQYPLPNEIIGRDQIQNEGMLPQILITNYAMLEYLLLRPQDSPLFRQGQWRFIVLDEAHTYSGAQGIEVGLLMRRLKHRLGKQPGEMRCIATSATLTDDDAADACRFAEALFGEKFDPDDIIFGEPDHAYIPPATPRQPAVEAYVHPQFDELLRNVRQENWESTDEMALLMQEIGLITTDELSLADAFDPPRFLWESLRGNMDLTRLRQHMVDKGQPVEVSTVAQQLFNGRLPAQQQQDALYHLIELAAMARPSVDEASLLPARYHLFVRPPQGIWACLNPGCPEKTTGEQWSKLFAAPRERCNACQSPVYPLVVCRSCGQVYLRLQKVGRQYLAEAALELEPAKRYVTWRPIYENRALAEDKEEDDEGVLVEQAGESVFKQTELALCLQCQEQVRANGRCGCERPSPHITNLYLLQTEKKVRKGKSTGTEDKDIDFLHECGRCLSRALKNTEIATDVTLNALTPLAVLTEELYRTLPESNDSALQQRPGKGRKLLSFYDSRQGAARFAAFVQDVVNQQAYRRIIRESVANTANSEFWPDLPKISRIGLELALRYRVAHNDPNLSQENLPIHVQSLNQSQQERLEQHIQKQVFAEITTQLRSRQSLEALGLIGVAYFEPNKLPDFDSLAQELQLTAVETRTLVEHLLDDLRRAKVVTLPNGIQRDDPIFGRNKFSPRLVRREAGQYEVAWIGQTPRHRRHQLMQKVLQYKGLPDDESAVKQNLGKILDWLIDQSDILDTSRPAVGYQVRHDRLFFRSDAPWYRCDQCQRLNCRGDVLPCPHPHCQGTLQPVDINAQTGGGFYYDNLRQTTIPMRVEEHTAQLDPRRGRDYQNRFKNGEINMLSCSTTFEMGIDLGDLQAVVMSNIPPTVANYKQRAGRAGRRTSGTAFILAWASDRPHDQAYFKAPTEIINGRVRVPYLNVQNAIIIRRHVNAILLSEFLRDCAAHQEYNKNVGAFFDEQLPGGPYYARLSLWLAGQREHLLHLLTQFGTAVQSAIDPPTALQEFEFDLRQKGYARYQEIAGYYIAAIRQLLQQQQEMVLQGNISSSLDQMSKEMTRYRQLLERLRKEDIINHLSDRGVLPSYSFPLHTVELRIPPHLLPPGQLRLQRNLQQAIREYAPGQEVVADKRIWKSEALEFFGKEPQVFAYHICPTCNHLRLEQTAGKQMDNLDEPCPICQTPPKRGTWPQSQYIEPDGFRASNDSGQPAGQYVDRPFNKMRSALIPGPVETHTIGQVLSVGYDRAGALLYVNEGFQGSGFKICPKCGKNVYKNATKCDGRLNGQPCPGKPDKNSTYTLGFQQDTDTLHLKFTSAPHVSLPEPNAQPFWLSLQYALLQGACRALQIERKDIDGVLFPEAVGPHWRQSIVLYDNVPGGAGHVQRIRAEIQQVVAAALEIVDCDCETSCYRCLREYGNQLEHHLLDRGRITDFLRALDADLQQSMVGEVAGLHPVTAVNPLAWLSEQLKQAQESVVLGVNQLDLAAPTADNRNWLDLLQELLQRKVKARLFLNYLPIHSSSDGETIMLATHLRLLQRKGLDLRLTNRQLPWTAVIDPQSPNATAIKTADGEMLLLTHDGNRPLQVTQHGPTVADIATQLASYRGRPVEDVDLREPADTTVQEITPDGKKHSEADYFAHFYAQPVRNMFINDRYLQTADVILHRVGAHIALAQQHGTLERVTIQARADGEEQRRAIKQLKARFPLVDISFRLDYHTAHDRHIELTRTDGRKARAIIGMGLDFIERDGTVRPTFIVIQDPFERKT